MKRFATLFVIALCAAALAGASVQGEYIEARNADVFVGACFANAEVGNAGDLAIMGWRISKGVWQGVSLDGLSVMGVIRARSTLGDPSNSSYPVRAMLIIDERASASQRIALKSFAQRMGGDLLQDVVRIEYLPVNFSIQGDVHSATATLAAADIVRIETRAMAKGDHYCANTEAWYLPLTKVDHAMGATAVTNYFRGKGLDANWSIPGRPSAYVGTFQLSE
jgi:hypothetical protein